MVDTDDKYVVIREFNMDDMLCMVDAHMLEGYVPVGGFHNAVALDCMLCNGEKSGACATEKCATGEVLFIQTMVIPNG